MSGSPPADRSDVRKTVSGGCHDGLMTGDDRGDTAIAHDAVVDARREAAAALARLAGAAVRYADVRIAETTPWVRQLLERAGLLELLRDSQQRRLKAV